MGKKRQIASPEMSSVTVCVKCNGPCVIDRDGPGETRRLRCKRCGAAYSMVLMPVDDDGWKIIAPGGAVSTFPTSEALRAALPASETVRTSHPSGLTESVISLGWDTTEGGTETSEGEGAEGDDEAEPVSTSDVQLVNTSESEPPSSKKPGHAAFKLAPPPTPTRPRSERRSTPPPLPRSPTAILLGVPNELHVAEPTPPFGSAAVTRTISAPTAELTAAARATLRGLGGKQPTDGDAEARLLVYPPTAEALAAAGRLVQDEELDVKPAVEKQKQASERLSRPPPPHRSQFPRVKDVDLAPREDERAKIAAPSLPPPTLPRRRPSASSGLDDAEVELALVAPSPPRRGGWLVAGGLVAAAGVLVFCMQVNAGSNGDVARTAAPSTQAAISESPRVETKPTETAVAITPSPSVATSEPPTVAAAPSPPVETPAARPAPIAVAVARPPAEGAVVSDDVVPTSELLHRAHAALRSGDRQRAKQQFSAILAKEPSNVEANTGLGDIARADGDLPTARDQYMRALGVSPSYIPALLALADVKWDLGDRRDAQARYATIVDRLGERAPARARARSTL